MRTVDGPRYPFLQFSEDLKAIKKWKLSNHAIKENGHWTWFCVSGSPSSIERIIRKS
jgi:hypothetical protein